MHDFIPGFLKGARETPRVFFAPAIAIWRLLLTTTDSLVEQSSATNSQARTRDELPKNHY